MVTSSGGRGLVAAAGAVSVRSLGTGTSFGGGAAIECAFQDNTHSDVGRGHCSSPCRNDGIPHAAHDGDENNKNDDDSETSMVDGKEYGEDPPDVRPYSGCDDSEDGHSSKPLVSADSIQRFLEEKLRMNKEMTKSEFQAFLLDRAGILASDALLDSIFAATDKDQNGLLDSSELATYVENIRPSTKKVRTKYIVWACLTYAPMYLACFNLAASLLAAKTNIRERPTGDLYGNLSHPYWSIAAICDLIGNFGYVILKWEEERLAFENIQAARVRLIKWVHFDLPRFLKKAQRKVSGILDDDDPDDDNDIGYGQLPDSGSTPSESGEADEEKAKLDARSSDRKQNLMQRVAEGTVGGTRAMAGKVRGRLEMLDPRTIFDNAEEQKRMGSEALASIRSVLFDETNHSSSPAKPSVGDDGLDLRELRLLLETMGVFLADHALQEIFWEVDTDRSHTVSIEELIQYAKEREAMVFDDKKYYNFFKYLAILKRCCFTIGFWTAWLFVIGAIFWTLLSHATKASDFAIQQFLGLICVFYLSGALGNMTNLYQSTQVISWQIENARMMLRAASISIGLSQVEKGRVDSSRNVAMTRCSNELQHSIEEIRRSVQNRIRRDAVSKLRHRANESVVKSKTQSRQKLGQIVKSTRSGGGGGGTFSANDAEQLGIAQEEGALALFQIIDVSNDANVDEKELYDALVSLGVMIPSHVFSSLYKSVDESGDGVLQLEEFIAYVSRIQPEQTPKQRIMTTLKLMVRQISFYIVLVQITAWSLQTHAAYNPPTSPPMRARNMWLAGSFGWALGSLYFLARWPRSKGAFFDQMENAKFMIKESILDECNDFMMQEDLRLGANV